jgi:glycosyltransferase involved in cell wall biosynthesis
MRGGELERVCRSLEGQFDLIHIQTPFLAHRTGVRLARRSGLKTVETYHTYFEQYFHHYLPWVPAAVLKLAARTLSRAQCNAVDAVIAPSRQMADALLDYGVDSTIEVIPTGLDLQKLSGGDGGRFRAVLGIDRARPVMLSVGRVAFEKNIAFIIDVAARVRVAIPDVLLVIAGEGPALKSLRRRVAEQGLADNVRFVGYLERDRGLLDCYLGADVFVFASNTETQGLVLLEALGLGTPVVSTAVMGTQAVLAGARGAIVVDENAEQFAAAVVRVLSQPALRASLAACAAEFVAREWSSAEMARRLLALYQHVLARRPASVSAGVAGCQS